MSALTMTELRKDLFRHLDEAIESGRPILLKRKGETYAFRAERTPPPVPADRWARHDAWIAERRARGELPAKPREDDDVWHRELEEAAADGLAELHAEWNEFYGPEKT